VPEQVAVPLDSVAVVGAEVVANPLLVMIIAPGVFEFTAIVPVAPVAPLLKLERLQVPVPEKLPPLL